MPKHAKNNVFKKWQKNTRNILTKEILKKCHKNYKKKTEKITKWAILNSQKKFKIFSKKKSNKFSKTPHLTLNIFPGSDRTAQTTISTIIIKIKIIQIQKIMTKIL